MSEEKIVKEAETPVKETITPIKCLIGAVLAGAMAYGSYNLTSAIATTFANKPIHTTNQIVANISSVVRSLVVGVVSLGIWVFGIVTIGLLALGVQLLVQNSKKQSPDT
jgi:predicted PurR-regulated permease PerM